MTNEKGNNCKEDNLTIFARLLHFFNIISFNGSLIAR